MEISNVTNTDFHRQNLNKQCMRTEYIESNQLVAMRKRKLYFSRILYIDGGSYIISMYLSNNKSLQLPEYTKVMQMPYEK